MKNGKQPRPFKKPTVDPLAREVAYWINREGLTTAQIARRTGLCRSTVKRIRNVETARPQSLTLQFILRCYGQELVIRPEGSNR